MFSACVLEAYQETCSNEESSLLPKQGHQTLPVIQPHRSICETNRPLGLICLCSVSRICECKSKIAHTH